MHNEEDFINPPGRRIGALALIRTADGAVMLVEKKYKDGPARWGLPGGCAQPDEDAHDALRREVLEELGQQISRGALLVVHRSPQTPASVEGYNLVFDGGTLTDASTVRLNERELRSYWFMPPEEFTEHAADYTVRRIQAALRALDGGPAEYLAS